MIKTKADLKEYLAADKRQLNISRKHPRLLGDEIWKYEITLRKYEYWYNQTGAAAKLFRSVYRLIQHRKMVKYGFCIDPNCVGKGLSIVHIGTILIGLNAKVGENLRVHEGVNVGGRSGSAGPTIGNNVFLGTGCKVLGEISIADDVAVGANAVVVRDVTEKGISVAGVPAKKVSNNNSYRDVFSFNGGNPPDTV